MMRNTANALAPLRSLMPLAKWVAGALIVVAIWGAVDRLIEGSSLRLDQLGWRSLALATAMTLVYRVLNAGTWSYVLSSLGHRLPATDAARIWLVSEACRWLPGGVWNLGSRAALATRRGVPAGAVGASLGLELLLTIASWCLVMVVGLAPHPALLKSMVGPVLEIGVWPVVIAAVVALLLMAAAARHAGIRHKVGRALARLGSALRLRPRLMPATMAFLFYVALGVLNGLAFTAVLHAVAPDIRIPATVVVGVNAAAWLVGFFAIFAPGGLVVREGAAAALLVTWLPLEQGLLAATVWRLVQILVELVCLAPLAARRLGPASAQDLPTPAPVVLQGCSSRS